MHRLRLLLLPILGLLATSLPAEDLRGGAAGSHNRVPRFVLTHWTPGAASAFRFLDLPANTRVLFGMVGTGTTWITLPGIGSLTVDPQGGSFQVFPIPAGGLTLPRLPLELRGRQLAFQGIYLDGGNAGVHFTDGTRADFFTPRVMVGNSRQSSNSISVIDPVSRKVIQRLTNSENGCITYSPDRRWAFVCEPGLQRNRVVVYDLRKTPITAYTTIAVSGGIRYGCAMPRHGRTLYVPVHDGIAVIDMVPSSPTYMQETGKIATTFTGNAGTIFTGPLDVAVTPDGRKLYVSYGENMTWPAPSHVGVIGLLATTPTEKLIPVTTGGVLSLMGDLATRPRIKVSFDGLTVYTVEYGLNPASMGTFVKGFQKGAMINVISTITDKEIAAIPTGGYDQEELAIDRLGRNLWVAQQDGNSYGTLLRIDADRRSTTWHTVLGAIRIDPTPYGVGAGPKGVDVTPDGSTVYVSVVEDSSHPTPQVVTVDVATGRVTGSPITVESLCHTLRIQQR